MSNFIYEAALLALLYIFVALKRSSYLQNRMRFSKLILTAYYYEDENTVQVKRKTKSLNN